MMGWWPHNRDSRHSPEPVDRLPLTLVYSSWDSSQSWIGLVLNHISLASFLWDRGKWNKYGFSRNFVFLFKEVGA